MIALPGKWTLIGMFSALAAFASKYIALINAMAGLISLVVAIIVGYLAIRKKMYQVAAERERAEKERTMGAQEKERLFHVRLETARIEKEQRKLELEREKLRTRRARDEGYPNE